MSGTALITGIGGQDGAYLARFLLGQGYRVVGGRRPGPSGLPRRLQDLGIADDIELVDCDLAEPNSLRRALERTSPDEVYNLAAQSSVALSFARPVETAQVNAVGALHLLEAVRQIVPSARFFQASSCDMFGRAPAAPQDETTPFRPHSPYGTAKLFAHGITANYREAYGMHASSGILFNHESPLRGPEFVTRKITRALARIRQGAPDVLELGNLDAARDWGFAGDYVEGMWLMLRQERPEDFVLASGEAHTVREFVEAAARRFGFDLGWSGRGLGECGIDRRSGRTVVRVDPDFYRPTETNRLIGNPAKARAMLGWQRKIGFEALVEMMAEADDRRVRDGPLADAATEEVTP